MLFRTSRIAVLAVALTSGIKSAAAQDAGNPQFLQGEHLIVARVAGSNEFLAYSRSTGRWTSHTFGDNVTAVPVMGQSVCAFTLEGEGISEIVAVDHRGNWRPFPLGEEATAKYAPVVDRSLAVIRRRPARARALV